MTGKVAYIEFNMFWYTTLATLLQFSFFYCHCLTYEYCQWCHKGLNVSSEPAAVVIRPENDFEDVKIITLV